MTISDSLHSAVFTVGFFAPCLTSNTAQGNALAALLEVAKNGPVEELPAALHRVGMAFKVGANGRPIDWRYNRTSQRAFELAQAIADELKVSVVGEAEVAA